MNIGIIGTGNMGRILAEALIDGNAISPSSMMLTNRTLIKALDIKKTYQDIRIGMNALEVAEESDAIFICVKPHNIRDVLDSIKPALTKEKCVISITSPVSVEQIERKVPCSVVRIIPSITNRALSGVSLFSYGNSCTSHWKTVLNKLFSYISVPIEIDENITRVASDIVSCGPAFISYLVQRFITAAVNETEIDKNTATKLTSEMLIGLGALLNKDLYTLPDLQEKVCVKGGITGEGIKILEAETGEMFEHLFQATHKKFEEDLESLKGDFSI